MIASALAQMGFKRLVESQSSNGYVKMGRSSPRRRSWVRKMNGRFKGVRIMKSRKLDWKAFSAARKISGIYGDIINRLKMMDAAATAYPAVVLCGQWGLPVLSHPNANCRRNYSISFDRKLCFNHHDLVFAK